ncbi:hypothetical protein PRUPE_1G077900 [Prunus persica]|uniref:Uncharacterized protein n=1 Tax=Prunus persica TaxID=3760 RepID=A0A251QTY8_PRUPE|nr:hypothetical protein PRUPE_1G077900 [Prunus persica]
MRMLICLTQKRNATFQKNRLPKLHLKRKRKKEILVFEESIMLRWVVLYGLQITKTKLQLFVSLPLLLLTFCQQPNVRSRKRSEFDKRTLFSEFKAQNQPNN